MRSGVLKSTRSCCLRWGADRKRFNPRSYRPQLKQAILQNSPTLGSKQLQPTLKKSIKSWCPRRWQLSSSRILLRNVRYLLQPKLSTRLCPPPQPCTSSNSHICEAAKKPCKRQMKMLVLAALSLTHPHLPAKSRKTLTFLVYWLIKLFCGTTLVVKTQQLHILSQVGCQHTLSSLSMRVIWTNPKSSLLVLSIKRWEHRKASTSKTVKVWFRYAMPGWNSHLIRRRA